MTNICVFVPIGLLLPLLLRRSSWRRLLLAAVALSAGIEVTQYATAHLLGGGHIADVDDLIFNVLGAALGLLALAALTRVPLSAGLVDRFRWSPEPLRAGSAHPQGADAPSRSAAPGWSPRRSG
ncbi:VanZ family protein [Nocardioides sp. cx-169]|uniref:VanZ family protein n=1 Tax=Nocardioides sp. cx-169 TaxID=2899080 RepID=UPI0035A8D5DF